MHRVKSLGLREQHCGDPVLTVSSADTRPLIFTTCGLLVRKSKIQLQMGVETPRSASFVISLPGRIVLKAELQSRKSILAYVLLVSRCCRV